MREGTDTEQTEDPAPISRLISTLRCIDIKQKKRHNPLYFLWKRFLFSSLPSKEQQSCLPDATPGTTVFKAVWHPQVYSTFVINIILCLAFPDAERHRPLSLALLSAALNINACLRGPVNSWFMQRRSTESERQGAHEDGAAQGRRSNETHLKRSMKRALGSKSTCCSCCLFWFSPFRTETINHNLSCCTSQELLINDLEDSTGTGDYKEPFSLCFIFQFICYSWCVN